MASENFIFISYARKDKGIAVKLARDLREKGVSIWLDQFDIKAGQQWDRAVHEALKDCGSLLVILSSASVASEDVQDEVAYIIKQNKTVIPVLYEACDIPYRLDRLQYVDFRGEYDQGFLELIESVGVPQEMAPQSTKEQDEKDEKKVTEDRIKQAESEAKHKAEVEKKELQKEKKKEKEKLKTVQATLRAKPGGYWQRGQVLIGAVTIIVAAFTIYFVSKAIAPDIAPKELPDVIAGQESEITHDVLKDGVVRWYRIESGDQKPAFLQVPQRPFDNFEKIVRTMHGSGSRTVITAGTADESTYEVRDESGNGNSVFTRAFLDAAVYGLKNNETGFTTINEIFAKTEIGVKNFADEYEKHITPRIWSFDERKYRGSFLFVNPQAKGLSQDSSKQLNVGVAVRNKLPFKKSIAFLIGISRYENRTSLPFVENDLRDVKDFLISVARFDTVFVAANEIVSEVLIEDYMANRFRTLNKKDRLLFYYSGRGADFGGTTGYILLSKANPQIDLVRHVLPIKRCRDWSKILQIDHILFVYDCFASGFGFTER